MTAFSNALTHVVVGNTANTQAEFMVPDIFTQLSSGYITFDLIDADNVVYATGNGTSYLVTPSNESFRVTSNCAIVVPSDLPITVVGTQYQIRFTLHLPDEDNQEFYIYDTIVVLPATSVELGAADKVELINQNIPMELVTADLATSVTLDVYYNNTQIYSGLAAGSPTPIADGYKYSVVVSTVATSTPASLTPYNVVWNYTVGGTVYHESAHLFVVTPSILTAMKDVYMTVNKSRASFGYQSVFSETELLTYLRNGADYFNGLFNPTVFTMTNAVGPVRYYWLQCCNVIALRAQYLMEGESAFNFAGQSVSLDVDRTQYYEGLASALDQQIQDPLRQLKANLAKRGLIFGDGNVNPTALAFNAIGTIGISASQVSNMRTSNMTGWMIGPRGPL